MKKVACGILALLALGGAYLLGVWSNQRTTTPASPQAVRKILFFVDPMHPAYTSDKPGIAPDCGMELVPVYEDGGMGGSGARAATPAGAVTVSPDRQQLIGVKVATAERAAGRHVLRVLGRVIPDETRLYRVNSATDGWVKRMLPATTDSLVQKDELLATFYAPEFFSGMKAYLFGLRSQDRFESSGKETKEQLEQTGANIENYRNTLRNLGMTEHQLDEIQRTRQGADQIEIRAPAAGLVLVRNLSPGQRFEKGAELYRIADLAQVWILADTFETEAAAFKPGMQVRVSAPNLDKPFTARVANVPPKFDSVSRAMKVRLEADNPGYALRPDMFVDVEIPVLQAPTIAVPVEALLDAGRTKTVFVERGEGIFEPRAVETGWRVGDRVEIRKGLAPGERIAVSAVFLLDSESRMRTARPPISVASHEGHAHAVPLGHEHAETAPAGGPGLR